MNIEDFVATSLEQMVAGVKRAQPAVGASGGRVNPQVNAAMNLDIETSTIIQTVQFDLAVTATESSRSGGGVKAGISVLSAKFGGGSDSEQSTVSRIKFSLPVVFPRHYLKGQEPEEQR